VKELIEDLAAYNGWADKRLLDAVSAMPPEVADTETLSSNPTKSATFTHLYWAGRTWLRRLEHQEPVPATEDYRGRFPELASGLQALDAELAGWVSRQQEAFLVAPFEYYNTRNQLFRMPLYQCLVQAFNHGTYHRGQVVTMLRERGVTEIPGTDYIIYKRMEQAGKLS
jgi:uncharacterized damage-inducible protein DinB